jgi:phosphoglycerol transferase
MLGKAKCLGDYLSDLGYQQYFLVGPDLQFSGMDKFYRNHGYEYTFGKQELLEAGMPEDKLTGWGASVNDDTLLDLAFEQVLALHARSQRGGAPGGAPLNVTVITTDNQAPDGYLSPRCPASDPIICQGG